MQHQNYFINKEDNKRYAQQWTQKVSLKYNDNINISISGTKYYDENWTYNNPIISIDELPIYVEETDSVSAIFNQYSSISFPSKICVLNFASYKNPGGMFIEGSNAQEECLCRESTLYPVLKAFESTYYINNRSNKNRSLYLNRALYNPCIVFDRDGMNCSCDVLTCAAPNFKAGRKYCNVSEKENSMVLTSRCEFILNIMKDNKVKIPILGAFGCGVFGQNALEVANVFKSLLYKDTYFFEKVVFAVIPGPNAEAFKRVFS